jgi:hypothetical protein
LGLVLDRMLHTHAHSLTNVHPGFKL